MLHKQNVKKSVTKRKNYTSQLSVPLQTENERRQLPRGKLFQLIYGSEHVLARERTSRKKKAREGEQRGKVHTVVCWLETIFFSPLLYLFWRLNGWNLKRVRLYSSHLPLPSTLTTVLSLSPATRRLSTNGNGWRARSEQTSFTSPLLCYIIGTCWALHTAFSRCACVEHGTSIHSFHELSCRKKNPVWTTNFPKTSQLVQIFETTGCAVLSPAWEASWYPGVAR